MRAIAERDPTGRGLPSSVALRLLQVTDHLHTGHAAMQDPNHCVSMLMTALLAISWPGPGRECM